MEHDEKFKVKIHIAGRVYPMTVNAKQEESLRKAAKNIESLIEQFESNYATKDKQDVLAMCSLQFATLLEQQKISAANESKTANEMVKSLNKTIDAYVS